MLCSNCLPIHAGIYFLVQLDSFIQPSKLKVLYIYNTRTVFMLSNVKMWKWDGVHKSGLFYSHSIENSRCI